MAVDVVIRDTEGNIGGKRVVGEIDGLRDMGDLGLPAGAAIVVERATVDQNGTLDRLEQAEQQVHQRRLARPGGAGDPDPFALGDGEADVVKHRSANRIGEAYVLEGDRPAEGNASGGRLGEVSFG